jgi:hypothetical protein
VADESQRLRLDNLRPQPGSRKKAKRKGRGTAAGQGNSCGFGMFNNQLLKSKLLSKCLIDLMPRVFFLLCTLLQTMRVNSMSVPADFTFLS